MRTTKVKANELLRLSIGYGPAQNMQYFRISTPDRNNKVSTSVFCDPFRVWDLCRSNISGKCIMEDRNRKPLLNNVYLSFYTWTKRHYDCFSNVFGVLHASCYQHTYPSRSCRVLDFWLPVSFVLTMVYFLYIYIVKLLIESESPIYAGDRNAYQGISIVHTNSNVR